MVLDYLVTGAVLMAVLTGLWTASVILANSSIIDSAWGAGFVLCAWSFALLTDAPLGMVQWLLLGLVTIWGVRLSAYITWRNWGKGEDYRYRQMRDKAGPGWWWQSYFTVFWLQGLLILIIAAPLYFGIAVPRGDGPGVLLGLGLVLWLVGFAFEAGGDWQLARFKARPENRGKVLDAGFWRYTRHPNYFGDAAQWWGFFCIAAGSPGAWWTLYAPILMTFLLVRVSGVALLEKGLAERKPAYADYIRRTPAFVPWLPKRD